MRPKSCQHLCLMIPVVSSQTLETVKSTRSSVAPISINWKQTENPLLRVPERLGCKPPEAWALNFPRMPDCPIILLFRNAGIARYRLSFRPAYEVIEGVNCSRWTTLEPWGPVWMAERSEIEQHSHASAGPAAMCESFSDEGISKSVRSVGRVCNDILR